jgi:hypothetical protein
VLDTLPRDHPVHSAVLASYSAATEEWREANHLSLRNGTPKPDFLLGGFPTKDGGVIRIGRYLPFAPGNPVEAGADLLYPQYGAQLIGNAALGVDFTGKELPDRSPLGRAKATALSLTEAHVPGAGVGGRITGLGDKARGKDSPTILNGKDIGRAVLKEVNPAHPVGGKQSGKKVRKRKDGLPALPALPKLPKLPELP